MSDALIHDVERMLLRATNVNQILVLDFLVHSGIGGGYIVPTDFETSVKPQTYVQIR